ncbi:MAG: T9SS type A sorting domain-containing protein [Phaeodactylibacter sp.]|nr:T9SS type A sorting domain-containing protein [Phaeodactylibacter sp.]MCB9276990.1 T9SS type A sorting domain-containing protein [Lewinellaceae bacterium]
MKKIVLLLLGFVSWSAVFAQETTCSPDANVADTVVVAPLPYSPDTPELGITDTACVGSYYNFTFTFNIPATYTTDFGDVPLTSVAIAAEGGVQNLPTGFDYVCNPPNCTFPAETSGCVVVFGTPQPGQEGVYDLKVTATIVTPFIPIVVTMPDDIQPGSNYFLHVKPEGFQNCFMVGTQETFASHFSISNQPNPTSGWTQINVESEVSGDYDFLLSDILGKVLHRERIHLHAGENRIEYDGSHLPNGVYLYSISDGRDMVSRKLAISRR